MDGSFKVLLGDYNIEFGQGLVLWRPYSFSKGSQAVLSPLKNSKQITPYLSTEENLFFRGSCAALELNGIIISAFYSKNKIDGNTLDRKIITFGGTGYHRTITEISKIDRIKNENIGINFQYLPLDNFNLGLLYTRNKFNNEFIFNNVYGFKGYSKQHLSFSFNFRNKGNMINGEIAHDLKSASLILNYYLELNENIHLLFSYRNYSPLYHSFYANGFSEYGRTQNEIGFYVGTKIKTLFGIFNIYFDQFLTKTESYYSIFPINGYDTNISYEYRILPKTKLKLKLKYENKEIEERIDNFLKVVEHQKMNLRTQIEYKIFKTLVCRSRVEFVETVVNNKIEHGLLSYQDIKFRFKDWLKLKSRIVVFDSDSYFSRVYEFENDMRGVMTNIPLYEKGLRWYILLELEPLKILQISIKYSETMMPDLRNIGSGYSEIKGNIDNTFGMQIDIKL